MRDFEKQRNEGFYDIELAYEQIIEQSVVDKMREIESLSQPVKDDDPAKKGFKPGKTVIHLIMVHALSRVIWRGIKDIVKLPKNTQPDLVPHSQNENSKTQPKPENVIAIIQQLESSMPDWAILLRNKFQSEERVFEFIFFIIMFVAFWMTKEKIRKEFCNLKITVFDGMAYTIVNMINPLDLSKTTINQYIETHLRLEQLQQKRQSEIQSSFLSAIMGLTAKAFVKISKDENFDFSNMTGDLLLTAASFIFKRYKANKDFALSKELLDNKVPLPRETKESDKVNKIINGLLSPLHKFIQKIVDYYNGGLMNKIVIGTIASLGVTILFKVTCRQILNGIMQLEIPKDKFSKLIEKIVFETVKPTHNILFAGETVDDSNPDFPIIKLKFRLLDKIFDESNTVASQRQHIFKEILKNMPQNVFVSKIEYVSYDRNNDNTRVPQNTENNVKGPPINRLEVARNNANATINLFQVLYTYGSRRDPRKATSKPHFADGTYYYPQELNHVDREMIRYAKEHEQLYRFLNRKWISRNYVFDIMTDPVRPKMLSPSVPSYYVCRFTNKTNENLKQHFKEKTDIFHLKRIDRPPENKDLKETRFVNDVYEVHLKVTKFSERNIEQIIDDIPEGLQAINVTRPLDKSFKHTKCKEFHIYPSTRSNFLKRLFWSNKCEIPDYLKHPIDDRVIESFKKRQVKERQRIKKVKQKLMLDFKDVIDQEYSNAELQRMERLRLSNMKISPMRKQSKKYKGHDQTPKKYKSPKTVKLANTIDNDDRW